MYWWRIGCLALVVSGFASLQAQTTIVALSPLTQHISVDSSGKVRIAVQNVQGLHAYTMRITYNPSVLICRNIQGLQFFGSSAVLFKHIDTLQGYLQVDEALLGQGSRSGSGDLFEAVFVGVTNGTTQLQFDNADLRDIMNGRIVVQTSAAAIQVGQSTEVTEQGHQPISLLDVSNFPNPFNLSTVIVIRGSAGGATLVRIYSILGEEVFRKEIAPTHDGVQTVIWDGRDRSANVVPTGLYIVKVEVGAFARSRKIMLVK